MNIPELAVEHTRRNEGLSTKPYECTAGKLTIGIGRNLEDKGLSVAEVEILYHNDLLEVIADLYQIFPFFDELSDPRKAVLIDMRFQLGGRGFRGFKNMIAAIQSRRFEEVPAHLLDSKYARVDTPRRAMQNAETWEREEMMKV